jgi:phage repressor protein C with HTH and peptisase S24 domain
MWDAPYMSQTGPLSPLQLAVKHAIARSGRARGYWDDQIQLKTGKSGKPLYDIERGKSRKPSLETLTAIAEVFDLPLEFFTRPSVSGAPDLPVPATSFDDETVEIVQVDLSFSMGLGRTVDDYVEEVTHRFDLDYLRRFSRTAPEMLRLGRGVGDSMYPTLLSSDSVWIDMTQREVSQQDRIWAISIHGAAAIKRLRRIGQGRILVMSDNPAVADQELAEEEIFIGGRVVRLERDI